MRAQMSWLTDRHAFLRRRIILPQRVALAKVRAPEPDHQRGEGVFAIIHDAFANPAVCPPTKLRRGSVDRNAAFDQHQQAAANQRDVLRNVGRQQDQTVSGEVAEQVAKAHPCFGIKASGGFVNNQDTRQVH